jgi:hypothetical protein
MKNVKLRPARKPAALSRKALRLQENSLFPKGRSTGFEERAFGIQRSKNSHFQKEIA